MKLRGVVFPLWIVNFSISANRNAAAWAYQPVRHFSRQAPSISFFNRATMICKNVLGLSESERALEEHTQIHTTGKRVPGTEYRVLRYPHPKLRAENERVNDFNSALQQLTAELLHIMYAAPGVGLAAPQVGVNKRIMVFNDKAGSAPRSKVLATEKVLINPEIIARSAETKLGDEGCLSFPKIYGKVPRSTWIDISYQTITGEVRQERMQGYSAVVFQHEYDHLDGVLLVDRLVPGDKERNRPHLDKLIKRYGPGGVL